MVTKENPQSSLVAELDQPLIALILEENGRDVVRYFVDDDEATSALSSHTVEDALALAGAWSDLDWDEMMDELERIRHESTPTPPIDDL